MSDRVDRRDVLKWIGAAVIGGPVLAGLSGCGGEDGGEQEAGQEQAGEQGAKQAGGQERKVDHTVPHPDDNTVPDAEAKAEALGGASRSPDIQQPKEQVKYQHTPNGDQHCGGCTLYVPDQNGDGFGACTTVGGKIHPCDWCNLYVEHTGEGVVPCGGA